MDWSTILLAIAIGLAGLITTIFTGLKEILRTIFSRWMKKLNKRTYVERVERLARFLETFEDISEIKEVQRCILFHGKNCGGLPCPGKPYTVRAIHAWVIPGKDCPLEKYNFDVQVDAHYIKILEGMIKNNSVELAYEEMPKDSKLKHFYEAEGVKYSLLFYLGLIDQELVFISLASYEKRIGDTSLARILIEVERLRSLVEDE